MCYIACAGPIIASPHACGDHAGGLRQPPICRHAPKTFSQSLVHLSYTHVHLSYARSCVCHPFNRRPKASSAACARPPRPRRRPSPATHLPSCAQNFLPNLSYISRIRTYPLVRAFRPVPPLQPPHKGFQRGLCPPRRDHAGGLRQPTVCRHAPKTFFAQSLVNASATLVHVSYARAYQCHPFNRRKKASSAARARPAATTPAPFASQPSAVMHRKLFCPISRPSLVNARHSLVPARTSAPPSAAADRLPACPVPSPRRDAGGLRQPPTTPGAGEPDPGPAPENGRQPG